MPQTSRVLAASVLATLAPLRAQAEPATGHPRIVDRYVMSVRLDAGTRTLTGTQRITWHNPIGLPTGELRFHLYWNAFRDRDSTFMREADVGLRAAWRAGEFGSIDVARIELVDGERRTPLAVEFVQPDDANTADRTVARVALPTSLAPGASIELETTFVARAPKAYRRTGWVPGDGFFCMHWFPKLGVLNDRDGAAVWNCPQFHANTEFFADFATYDVTIDVPAGFVVGATGGMPDTEREGNGRRVLRFVAPRVHDFAWVADPDFREHRATFEPFPAANDPTGVAPAVARRLGVDVATFDLPAVELRLLLQPEHDSEDQVRRHLDAARCALEFFGLRFGPWPYPTLTIVDPGRDVEGRALGGGMEYPMLIMCGTPDVPHARALQPEGVTVHEFGHQYWYGLVANDEFHEAWLDEGINTFSESRALSLRYGPTMQPVHTSQCGMLTFAATFGATLPADPLRAMGVVPRTVLPAAALSWVDAHAMRGTWLPESPLLDVLALQPSLTGFREVRFVDAWNDRRRWLDADNPDGMVRPGWEYLSRDSYRANAYTRPATLLGALERQGGRDAFWTFLRRFHTEFRFGHPTTADFVARLERDLGPAAVQTFRAATAPGAVVDFAIHSVSPADGRGVAKSVVIRNRGTLALDTRIRFRFEGLATPLWRQWDADDPVPWREFRFTTDDGGRPLGRLLEVWIDPPSGSPDGTPFELEAGAVGVQVLDSDLTNNAWRADADPIPAAYRSVRLLLQTQSKLTFAGVIG